MIKRIEAEIISAMKAKEAGKLECLRSMKTALIAEKNKTGKELSSKQETQVLITAQKQRVEAAIKYREGGREDLAIKEDFEAEFIGKYLPMLVTGQALKDAANSAAEILHEEGKPVNIGSLMKHVQETAAKYNRRIDGKELQAIIKDILI